ncbi:MAG: haloacid dehalogenase [Marmoricola sp.]|nr:haloacid dehalogenase [Marmoricola sp.]
MSAILFGSISTIADTSELQRESFNEAFAQHGLDWRWDRDDYRTMLASSGGRDRIAEFARSRGEDVDAEAVHRTKSDLFVAKLGSTDVHVRPGVKETVDAARSGGMRLALVTTTSPANVAALAEAVRSEVDLDRFDLVVDATQVDRPKPDRAAYLYALTRLQEEPQHCVALEDNVGGVEAAAEAGVRVLAFPNENTEEHDFARADRRIEALSFDDLPDLIA